MDIFADNGKVGEDLVSFSLITSNICGTIEEEVEASSALQSYSSFNSTSQTFENPSSDFFINTIAYFDAVVGTAYGPPISSIALSQVYILTSEGLSVIFYNEGAVLFSNFSTMILANDRLQFQFPFTNDIPEGETSVNVVLTIQYAIGTILNLLKVHNINQKNETLGKIDLPLTLLLLPNMRTFLRQKKHILAHFPFILSQCCNSWHFWQFLDYSIENVLIHSNCLDNKNVIIIRNNILSKL